MTLVHTGARGPEALASSWAKDRNVPEILYEPRTGSCESLSVPGRLEFLLQDLKPVRIYDFSEPGNIPMIAEIADRASLCVSYSRSAVERAPRADRGPSVSQGVSAGEDFDMANRSGISHSY